jgi:hypothetical protein
MWADRLVLVQRNGSAMLGVISKTVCASGCIACHQPGSQPSAHEKAAPEQPLDCLRLPWMMTTCLIPWDGWWIPPAHQTQIEQVEHGGSSNPTDFPKKT